MPQKKPRLRMRWILLLLVVLAVSWGVWGALLRGPNIQVKLTSDRPAIGPGTALSAHFIAGKRGLGLVRLEVVQGDCRTVLAEESFERPSTFEIMPDSQHREWELNAIVGRGSPECLKEGDVVLRASALRAAGPLRGEEWSVVETTLPAVFRPPSIQVTSTRHYLRQGGSGIVTFRVLGDAVRSGVRVGRLDLESYPLAGNPRERMVLFGIPWDLDRPSEIRLYAEDAAGNRAEAVFLDHFKAVPPRKDTIRLPDSFLERVVPAIASQTPGFDSSGSLIEQYVRINSDMRVANRAFIAELSKKSEPRVYWEGPFVQLKNSARRAGYGETRSYRYQGREVDTQTHLGLDLASVARAPIEAPNAGRVIFTGFLGIYGNAIIIDHGYGMLSICAHLSSIAVQEGQLVRRAETIGRTGATGLAGGDHLHLGIFLGGVAVDPMEWLDGNWINNRIRPYLPAKQAEDSRDLAP